MLQEMRDRNMIGFLATVDEEGKPRLRPLMCMMMSGKIYFSTAVGTRKTKEIAMNPWVEIVIPFAEDDTLSYIRLSGEAFRIFDETVTNEIMEKSGYRLDSYITVLENESVILYEVFPTHVEKLHTKEKRLEDLTEDFFSKEE
jgi:uncharacterized pyridoxamine 5'-phosphate oxidase family protein